ncbi:hypothetical protein Droror1_Dr00010175 [Drosera rotundifolia]
MTAVSIIRKIIVLAYLVHHVVATNSSYEGSFQLVDNAATRTGMRTNKGSKSRRHTPPSPAPPKALKQPPPPPALPSPLQPPLPPFRPAPPSPLQSSPPSTSSPAPLNPTSPLPPPTSAPLPLTPPGAPLTLSPPNPPIISAAPAPSPPLKTNPQFNFTDQRLAVVFPVIQRFKRSITLDPFNVTGTWVGSDICNYTGFYCSNPPDNVSAITVASIDFNGYRLSAPSLDGFIDQFPDLAVFHANSNFFSGIISPNITKLRYLYELDISNNIFTGPFPSSVVGANGLIFLDVRYNLFSGSVPPAIYIQNLYVLFLNDNSFMSTLPATLGSTQILYLTLEDNNFTGPIPSNIDKVFSNLTEVLLQNNKFNSCIPYQLGLLKQVTLLDISKNLLTGSLPFSLGCLQNAQVLDFSDNMLYGLVPDPVCRLPNLVNLTLSNNYFTLVGKDCWPLIKSGVLDVTNNCILGLPLQRPIIECLFFFAVPRFCPHIEPHDIIPCKLPPPW